MGRKKQYTPGHVEQIRQLHAQGLNDREISRRVGLSSAVTVGIRHGLLRLPARSRSGRSNPNQSLSELDRIRLTRSIFRELRAIRSASVGQLAARILVEHEVVERLLTSDSRFIRSGQHLTITYSLDPELW